MKLFEAGKPFYKGNLHTHTTNSDGRLSPETVLDRYGENGYDFIALTDHWKRTTGSACLRGGMLVLPGIELDYMLPAQVIHVVGVGVDESVLSAAKHAGPQKGIDSIRKAGGRAILAHPAWSLNTPEVIGCLKGLTAAEIYNSVSGMPWNGDRADSTDVLDVCAAHGCLLNTVASDDSHFYEGEECTSYIMLQAEALTQEEILRALDRGAFYSTRGPRFEQIEVKEEEIRVTCSAVSRIVFHSDLFYVRNRTVSGEGMTEAVYRINKDRSESFVRVILIDEQGRRAWSNLISV